MGSSAELYIIRHGETNWNKEGRIQGTHDDSLNDEGILQAERIALDLAHLDVMAVYSSPQKRSRETATIIASHHALPVLEHRDLREGTFGEIEGMAQEDFKVKFLEKLIEHHKASRDERLQSRIVPGCESLREIATRSIACLQEIASKHEGQQVAVVTHGWVMRSLLVMLHGCDDRSIFVSNGGMLRLMGNAHSLEIVGQKGVMEHSWI